MNTVGKMTRQSSGSGFTSPMSRSTNCPGVAKMPSPIPGISKTAVKSSVKRPKYLVSDHNTRVCNTISPLGKGGKRLNRDQLKHGGYCVKAANAVAAYVRGRDFSTETVQVIGDRQKFAC